MRILEFSKVDLVILDIQVSDIDSLSFSNKFILKKGFLYPRHNWGVLPHRYEIHRSPLLKMMEPTFIITLQKVQINL